MPENADLAQYVYAQVNEAYTLLNVLCTLVNEAHVQTKNDGRGLVLGFGGEF